MILVVNCRRFMSVVATLLGFGRSFQGIVYRIPADSEAVPSQRGLCRANLFIGDHFR